MSEKPEITEQEAGPAAQGEPEGAAHGSDEPGQGEPDSRHLRLLEAVLFSAPEPITEETLGQRLPEGADIPGLLGALSDHYANHGINLVRAGGRWLFRTAQDLSEELRVHKTVPRRLSRAAMETLAIIAYHQPVTRAEIEEIRGVGLSRGTLDLLLEANWVAPKGRRRRPAFSTKGRPCRWSNLWAPPAATARISTTMGRIRMRSWGLAAKSMLLKKRKWLPGLRALARRKRRAGRGNRRGNRGFPGAKAGTWRPLQILRNAGVQRALPSILEFRGHFVIRNRCLVNPFT